MEHPADCDEMPSRRGSNFGRVDALRWWFKLRHDGAPPCPGACFQTQRSKRKPHERAMCDNLEVRAAPERARECAPHPNCNSRRANRRAARAPGRLRCRG